MEVNGDLVCVVNERKAKTSAISDGFLAVTFPQTWCNRAGRLSHLEADVTTVAMFDFARIVNPTLISRGPIWGWMHFPIGAVAFPPLLKPDRWVKLTSRIRLYQHDLGIRYSTILFALLP